MNEANDSIPRSRREINLSEKHIHRFWRGIDKDGPIPDQSNPHYSGLDSCWMRRGFVDRDGYTQFSIDGVKHYSHRISWIIHHGKITDGMLVLHKCDNGTCVNPNHLFLGSSMDNSRDAVEKGRISSGIVHGAIMLKRAARGETHGLVLHPERRPRGESHGNSKLTEEDVVRIRDRLANGNESQSSIARDFGVTFSAVHSILKGKSWTHVPQHSKQ